MAHFIISVRACRQLFPSDTRFYNLTFQSHWGTLGKKMFTQHIQNKAIVFNCLKLIEIQIRLIKVLCEILIHQGNKFLIKNRIILKPLSHQTAMPQHLYSVQKICQRAVGSPQYTV